MIEPKHHRSILGPKGCNVQAITQDHDVSIKFPDREKPGANSSVGSGTVPNGGAAAGEGTGSSDGDAPVVNGNDDGPGNEEPTATTAPAVVDPRSIILITGRQENADAAKQALMVSALLGILRIEIHRTCSSPSNHCLYRYMATRGRGSRSLQNYVADSQDITD